MSAETLEKARVAAKAFGKDLAKLPELEKALAAHKASEKPAAKAKPALKGGSDE